MAPTKRYNRNTFVSCKIEQYSRKVEFRLTLVQICNILGKHGVVGTGILLYTSDKIWPNLQKD